MVPRQNRKWLAYLAALIAIGAATAIRFSLHDILGEHLIFSVYYLAVSVAAWTGGIQPALVTAVLSSLLANFLFSAPRGSLRINNAEEFCALALFLGVSTVIGVLSELSLRADARARFAEQMKDDFLAILAHELRNPLAVIHYTNRDSRRSGSRNNSDRSEVIDRQVQQLNQMIDDLLDIAHVSRGTFRIDCQRVEASDVVRGALEKARPVLESRGHMLTLDLAEEPLPLYGDPLRLEQVLVNLLRNAAKYTPRNGTIHLRLARVENGAEFRVRDDGEGIPKEQLGRIFDLHTQVERSLNRSGSGLGIGLSLVRTLVELHGGTVAAMSDGPGQGSEFVVRLPWYTGAAEAPNLENRSVG